jgi:CDP-paratose 2-epimerase
VHKVFVTGSSGLIGSAAVEYYDRRGALVHGADNNMRASFFGPAGDTRWNLERLRSITHNFTHHELDVRDRDGVNDLFRRHEFDLVIHCAAQPSHDKARDIPIEDFEVNAIGTLNLLEALRRHRPNAVFAFMSTNKVYGDVPNELPLVELETRWDYTPEHYAGISEECRVDRSMHSLFGVSKLAADVMVQEYGRYFGLKTGVFRGGCLTGPHHSGVQLHGFLSHLAKVAAAGEEYTVFGYKGKQVRDHIHSADVIAAIDAFARNPRPGEVYNIGGGRANSASILECFTMLEHRLARPVRWRYVAENRRGDHVCYITDLSKFRRDYPGWRLTHSLESIIDQILSAELAATAVAEA